MPATAAELNAYLNDAGIIAADQAKLAADQTTEASDSATVASNLEASGQAVLSADGKTVTIFVPVVPATTPPTFTTASYTLAQ